MPQPTSSRRSANRPGGRKQARRPQRRVAKLEQLESRLAFSSVPWGAEDLDTGEFMLGDVTVSVVFFESTGTGSNNTENWTETHRSEVKQRIEDAMQWWEDTLAIQSSVHQLNFDIDYTYADNPVPIGMEPISQAATAFETWVGTFLDYVGADRTNEIDNDVRRYNNQQRIDHGTNWAFTIFVINAQNDADGLFAPGSIRGAFSIAGGAFMALPSERPASTIAHETSHQFWAMDEYASSGDYTDTRGYYDTQNTNAYDGNPDRSSIVTSLLGDSASLGAAYSAHTSSPSSLASIGWQDSDGDGLFDVFDVPMDFSATSTFDPNTGLLRIVGQGAIGVLPNMNSWGLQNSITTNRISHVEYRVGNGSWETGPVIDDYTADIDFALQLPDGVEEVQFRLVDETGLIQSAILTASVNHIDSTPVHGFAGYVTYDANGNGTFEAGEEGLAGWQVVVTDAQGNPVTVQTIIEPDDYDQGEIFYDPINGVTLSAFGGEIDPLLSDVSSRNSTLSSTGGRGFYNYSGNSWSNLWSDQRRLRMDFATPVSRVSIDATAQVDGDIGILELYDSNGTLLGRYQTSDMTAGSSETMVVEIDSAKAAYAVARGFLSDSDDPHRQPLYVGLDNLQVGRSNVAITNELGAFTLPFDVAGNYRLQVVPGEGEESFFASISTVDVSLNENLGSNRASFSVDIADTSWHNPIRRADLNLDGIVDNTDIELVLSELQVPVFTENRTITAFHTSGDPLLDVNGDGRFDKLDLLAVIDAKTLQDIDLSSLDGEPDFVFTYTPLDNSSSSSGSISPESEPSPSTEIRQALPFYQPASLLANVTPSRTTGFFDTFSSVSSSNSFRLTSDNASLNEDGYDEDNARKAAFIGFVSSDQRVILDATVATNGKTLASSEQEEEATDLFFADLDAPVRIDRNQL